MSRKELRFGQLLLISWPQSAERRWTLLPAPNHGWAAEPPFPSWAACLSWLNHDSACNPKHGVQILAEHTVRVQFCQFKFSYQGKGMQKKVVKRQAMKGLVSPIPFPKDQAVQAEVSGNLSTVCVLRTVQFALKTAGRMSLPSLGTGSSLNTSLTMRHRAALYGRNVNSCRLFYSHCPALITRWNNLAWTYYLKVTKFIRGRKINAELPMHVLRPCSPFHFCDTQAVIFVFCNCLVSPLLLLML